MAKKSNHVLPSSSGWAVKKYGSSRASRTFVTKESAVIYGRELSKSENGMIQDRNSFSSDRNQPIDKS